MLRTRLNIFCAHYSQLNHSIPVASMQSHSIRAFKSNMQFNATQIRAFASSLLLKAPTKDETAVERVIRESKAVAAQIQQAEPIKRKAPLIQRVKEELIHYWHGTKLLGKEIGISSRLSSKLLQGQKLSRREQRQLKRTLADIARVIPFIVTLFL